MKNGGNFSHLLHDKLNVWCIEVDAPGKFKSGKINSKKLNEHARLLGSSEYTPLENSLVAK